jgi:RecB family endonuclease NucS
MEKNNQIERVIPEIKNILTKLINEKNEIFKQITTAKDRVIERYQPIFDKENIFKITDVEFKEFLRFDKNEHWGGLHRMGPKICADMDLLKDSLQLLVDEEQQIETRLDKVVISVKGMGKAIITAILLIEYPDKYGVWNSTSEGALKVLELWPKFERNESFGFRYSKVNEIFKYISNKLEIDLWTLDALWYVILYEGFLQEREALKEESIIEIVPEQKFGLERHLHEFLRDNWNDLPIGKDWSIYSEPGDDEVGYEYPCSIGRIDILAHHRNKPKWLVIELKRNQTSDSTVGQVLRYMGWVQEELAIEGETVQGMVIAHEADDSIQYALKPLKNIELKLYEVEFRLKSPSKSAVK